MTSVELDTFTRAYVEAALWSSTAYLNPDDDEDEGEPMDDSHSADDIAPETLAEMMENCASFQRTFGAFIVGREARAGHDFWLTRNGHGAGFWDGDWDEPYARPEGDISHPEYFGDSLAGRGTVGDYLTAKTKRYGSYNLYIGDDGLIHGQ